MSHPRRTFWQTLSLVKCYAKGCVFRVWCLLPGKRVTFAGTPLIEGEFPSIHGPGSVRFGIKVALSSVYHGRIHLVTYVPEAQIEIGNRCGLSGTRISCQERVTIREDSMLANTFITDTDAHDTDPAIRSRTIHQDVPHAPVLLEQGVWIGANTTILKGVTIGRGSTLGAHSLANRSLPANVVAVGVPARILRESHPSP